MGSKVVINVYLGIFLAAAVLLLLISSEVTTARELSHETSNNIRNVTPAMTCPPLQKCCNTSCKRCCGDLVKANDDKT
ncbi:hypothetical protein OROHE_022072 [Orobanche hederae]